MNLRRPDRLHKTAAGDAAYQNAKENTPHTMEAVVSSLKFDRVTTTNLGYRLNENRFEDEGGMFDEKNQQWKDAAKGCLDARLEGVGLTYFQPRLGYGRVFHR